MEQILDTNPIVVNFTAAAGTSPALGAKKILLISPVGCYFKVGANPTAVADPAQAVYLPPDVPYTIETVDPNDKVSAIRKDGDGWLQIVKLA